MTMMDCKAESELFIEVPAECINFHSDNIIDMGRLRFMFHGYLTSYILASHEVFQTIIYAGKIQILR